MPSAKVRLLYKAEVEDRVGVTYQSLWNWMRAGKFPRSRVLGNKVVWVESEVEEFLATLPARRFKSDKTAAA